MSETPTRKTKGFYRPAIMKYFEEHTGVSVYVDDLAKAAGCSRDQAQSCVNNIRREVPSFSIEVVVTGNVWRYVGKPSAQTGKPGKRIFEELAVTKTGDILIQDEAGSVYKAVEL